MTFDRLEQYFEADGKEFAQVAKLHWPAILKVLRVARQTNDNWNDYGPIGLQAEWQSRLTAALAFLEEVATVPAPESIL
jgi:hypothetical protein